MALLEVQDLTFSYDGTLDVLSKVGFSLAAGQSLLIVGDNGSGKSTLGRLLAGISNPTGGTITVDGELPAKVVAKKRCRLASYMGQVSHLSILTSTIASELISFSNGVEPLVLEEAYKEWAAQYSLPAATADIKNGNLAVGICRVFDDRARYHFENY